jgi:hypothetical protein
VVRRRGAGVVPGVPQRRDHLRRNLEDRVTGERPLRPADRCLQMADREVYSGHRRPDAGEQGAEVVAATAGRRGVTGRLPPQSTVEQDVAGAEHGDGARRGRCGRRRLRSVPRDRERRTAALRGRGRRRGPDPGHRFDRPGRRDQGRADEHQNHQDLRGPVAPTTHGNPPSCR